ncbi:MAG: hypothetical protein LBH32_01930 [Dysgonamonadaceae bacterium]|jgi:hypothetical protein|nr:hypothetical protein [Dysgonamonadaceae bacterium]
MYKKLFFLWMALFIAILIQAQNIETMLNAPVIAADGGITVNNISTFAPNDSAATDPFALYLSGNLNFSLLGTVNLPLTFAYTNKQLSKSVSLPFNRFALAPSYKWIKAYAGYTSMNFSPYSLAGHELFGGGMELTPDNGLKFSALYGRLQKSSNGADGVDPAYKRMGGGLKLEYQKEKYTVSVNLFKAQDIQSSLKLVNLDSLPPLPQDNLTGGMNFILNVVKNLSWTTEYGFSALDRNAYAPSGDQAVYHAVKTRLTFTEKIGEIGATYEYVAPNYTTLGAYYMTNDFENITANFSTVAGKFNIALDAGYQHNNLYDQKNSTDSRIIYSGSVSSKLSEKLDMAFTFSNLQSYLYINDVYSQVTQTNQFQNLDTLNVTQLNYTASFNTNFALQNTQEQRQNLNLSLMYQKSAEAQQYSKFSGNDIYNTSLGYSFSLVPLQFNASASVNYNYNKMPEDIFMKAMTCNFTLQKNFFKELNISLASTYSNMQNQQGNMSDILNFRLSGGYTLAKKHSFNLAATMLHSAVEDKKRIQYAINLSYAYSFGARLSRNDRKMKLDANF